MKFGMLVSDCPRDVEPIKQLDGLLRQVEVGQVVEGGEGAHVERLQPVPGEVEVVQARRPIQPSHPAVPSSTATWLCGASRLVSSEVEARESGVIARRLLWPTSRLRTFTGHRAAVRLESPKSSRSTRRLFVKFIVSTLDRGQKSLAGVRKMLLFERRMVRNFDRPINAS